MAAPKKPRPWLDCHAKLTNRELRNLYRARFSSVVQVEIVLFLIAQTRGTGRIMAGELNEPECPFEDWQEALNNYGRDAVPVYRGQIAAAVQRDQKQVGRELRRLMNAGVVIEHEAGHKGKPALLSVDLDAAHWKPSRLHTKSTRREGKGDVSDPETGVVSDPESAGKGDASDPPL